MAGSMRAITDGRKARLIRLRFLVWAGGSSDSMVYAPGLWPSQAGSKTGTKPADEKRSGDLSTAITSA